MARIDSAVGADGWQKVRGLGAADLLVGIPSFNNVSTIGHVAAVAAEGLALHFPSLKGVVVVSDGGSRDGTLEAFDAAPAPPGVRKMGVVYQGTSGKGSAFRAVFEVARALGVKGCMVVDSDLRSITPDWIRLLAAPVVEGGFGYVAPFYIRHKYDGTITNSIAYPLTRALYGVSVRQPIGGDFGFSAALLDHYLARDVWKSDVARFGIDIWMTTTAINEGFRVAQAQLGAKIHDAKDPAASLGPMFRQVVGTLFGLMGRYEANWRRVSRAVSAPLLGDAVTVDPEPIGVTVSAMIERFRAAHRDEAGFWATFLPAERLRDLGTISQLPEGEYRFPEELWVRTIYDFAAAYSRGTQDPDRVVDSLTGLYYGRTAAFCLETMETTTAQAENGPIASLARRFEELKPYLAETWGKM